MSVLVACEESQIITIEMRKNGIEAFSCDLMDCSGGHMVDKNASKKRSKTFPCIAKAIEMEVK